MQTPAAVSRCCVDLALVTMDSLEWPLNRPVSAHLTIHYTDGPRDDAGCGQDEPRSQSQPQWQSQSQSQSQSRSQSQSQDQAQDGPDHRVIRTVLNIDASSLRARSGGEAEDVVLDTPLGSPGSSRRSSGSQAHGPDYQYGACCCRPDFGNNSYITRRFSEPQIPHASDEDATVLPPFTRSSSYSSSAATNNDNEYLHMSCPNERYHRRRNSIAVKFHKASYRKS